MPRNSEPIHYTWCDRCGAHTDVYRDSWLCEQCQMGQLIQGERDRRPPHTRFEPIAAVIRAARK